MKAEWTHGHYHCQESVLLSGARVLAAMILDCMHLFLKKLSSVCKTQFRLAISLVSQKELRFKCSWEQQKLWTMALGSSDHAGGLPNRDDSGICWRERRKGGRRCRGAQHAACWASSRGCCSWGKLWAGPHLPTSPPHEKEGHIHLVLLSIKIDSVPCLCSAFFIKKKRGGKNNKKGPKKEKKKRYFQHINYDSP